MKEFEKTVIEELLQNSPMKNVVLSSPRAAGFLEFTGHGYFLTIQDPVLPINRVVLDSPDIQGKLGGVEVGYLAFVENAEPVLECYSYGQEISSNHRDQGFLRDAT